MVAYGAEGNLHSQNSLLIKNNTFIDNHGNGKGIYNHTDTAVTLQGNTFQDVETEVVGPHQFIDGGAANPGGDDGTTTAQDTTDDSLADDGLADNGSANDGLAGGSVNDETTTTTVEDAADDASANDGLADGSVNDGTTTAEDAASESSANDGLANGSVNDETTTAGDGSANDGLADGSVESANDLIDAPHKELLPRDLFSYTTEGGYHGKGSDFSDLFVNDHDDRDGAGSDGSAGDWWFDFY
jgi:hypothetical protein